MVLCVHINGTLSCISALISCRISRDGMPVFALYSKNLDNDACSDVNTDAKLLSPRDTVT